MNYVRPLEMQVTIQQEVKKTGLESQFQALNPETKFTVVVVQIPGPSI